MNNLRLMSLVGMIVGITLTPGLAAEKPLVDNRLTGFSPLPAFIYNPRNAVNNPKIRLGRMLYFDPRLCADHKLSCNSCHNLDNYGADVGKVSIGFKGQAGSRNFPTVYNAAGHLAQFWDGRAIDVEAQAKGPMMNPVEMAMTPEERVIATMQSMPEYFQLFQKAFPNDPNPVTFDNLV